MHLATHFLSSWMVSNSAKIDRNDRLLVTLSGVLPDLDSLGIIVEIVSKNTSAPLYWWTNYHHVLGHNIFFGMIMFLIVGILADRKIISVFHAIFSFHLHLFFDLIGSRGPEGFQWPIYYIYPILKDFSVSWDGQWALNAWPNILLTIILMGTTFLLAWKRRFSPLEMISQKADQEFVSVLDKWFTRY